MTINNAIELAIANLFYIQFTTTS